MIVKKDNPGNFSEWNDKLDKFCFLASAPLEELWVWNNKNYASQLAQQCAPEQLMLLAIMAADGEICNGGFWQFFSNSSGELTYEAIEGFARFGMIPFAEILKQAIAIFPKNVSKDREERCDLLAYTNDQMNLAKTWKPLESEYYRLVGQDHKGFYSPVAEFINCNRKSFFNP